MKYQVLSDHKEECIDATLKKKKVNGAVMKREEIILKQY